MSKYRTRLPQLDGRLFLTDGGLETTLIFHDGWELPIGEAFVLLDSARGRTALRDYYDRYILLAIARGAGFVLESPTWRANPDWAAKIDYGLDRLAAVNRAAIMMMHTLRAHYESATSPMVISGCIGPRGDGYDPGQPMSVREAQDYHAWQIAIFREAGADFVSAITMTSINEALGLATAAKAARMPCAISFTLETDGRLPTGEQLSDAIITVDDATDHSPAYYMINCAHPAHFDHVLEAGAPWMTRLRGIRANASKRSHKELDNAPELDTGNPAELGDQYRALLTKFPHINVIGGCCGTDHRHVAAISKACRIAA
jgi:S-methylmethionine-dependent homocysteine/selenocysteine methylase